MTGRQPTILVVEPDPDLAGVLAEHLARSLEARVTRAGSLRKAVRSDVEQPHHAVVAELALPDGDGLDLARRLLDSHTRPVVLMTEQPTVEQAVEGLRLGVRDLVAKPFDLSALSESLRREIGAHRQRLRNEARYRRLRRVSTRIIQERRDLRQRVDLVCRDIVHAYRRLAEKFEEKSDLPLR